MPQTAAKFRFRPATALLVALAVVFVVVGIVYLAKTANDLPGFFPGHQAGSTKHHTKHGLAMFALAALSLVGAWFTTAPGKD